MRFVAVVSLSLMLSSVFDATAQGNCELLLHADGSWESGYAWEQWESPPPDYGAFAERYSGDGAICGIALWGTQIGFESAALFDAFVWWGNFEDVPGTVICAAIGNDPPPIALWPAFTRIDVPMDDCCVFGQWWVGFRGAWQESPGFYVLADLDGPTQALSLTKVAPGLGFPEGWQNSGIARGEEPKALAIGALVKPCSPVIVEGATWGRVKSLYRAAR